MVKTRSTHANNHIKSTSVLQTPHHKAWQKIQQHSPYKDGADGFSPLNLYELCDGFSQVKAGWIPGYPFLVA